MKCYRIKHKISNYYFCPTRGLKSKHPQDQNRYFEYTPYVKTNLSVRGKIYTNKPSLSWIGNKIYTHVPIDGGEYYQGNWLVRTSKEDWEIEEL